MSFGKKVFAAFAIVNLGLILNCGDADAESTAYSSSDLSYTTSSIHYSNDTDKHDSSDEQGDHEEHRYSVVKLDFSRVATPYIISVWILFASFAKIGFHLNNKLSSIFPESCLLILLGVILGVILYFADAHHYELDTHVFFLFLLPPIILEAGYFMPARAFFDNIGTILLFAVVGTIFNTLLIGFSIWGFSESGGIGAINMELNMLHCLLLASLLSAVDPVAVLAVFEQVHVNEILHIVVFGESLLNDAVTVVMYHMFDEFSFIGQDNIKAVDIVSGVFSFVLVAICGTLIGVMFGLATAFITRFTDHVRVIEPLLVFTMGYLSYLTAEIFEFSGILACTFCGMSMKKYVEKNISQKSHTTIKYFMKMLASVCETIIFMFLGVSTMVHGHQWNTSFVLLTLFFCLLYRSAGVVIFGMLADHFSLIPINRVDKFIMAYGGLRGAIAYSLVALLNGKLIPQKRLFLTTTLVVIYFTVFVQGTTIKPLVNVLRVKKAEKRKPTMNEKIHGRMVDHLMAGIEDVTGFHGHHELRLRYEYIDNKYIKPLLVRDREMITRGRSIVNVYEKLMERDASEFLRKNASFVNSESFLRESSSFAELSSGSASGVTLQICGTDQESYGTPEPDSVSIPMPSNSSSTCLDMHALESQDAKIHRDDSKVHHIIDDALFIPRQRFTRHRRHMLAEPVNHAPFHHKARRNLRKMLSKQKQKQHKHDHKRGSKRNDTTQQQAKKSGPGARFLEVPEVTVLKRVRNDSVAEQIELGKVGESGSAEEVNKNGSDYSMKHSDVIFCVGPTPDDSDPCMKSERLRDTDMPETPECPDELNVITPTAAETSLPWKRHSDTPPVASTRSVSASIVDSVSVSEVPVWIGTAGGEESGDSGVRGHGRGDAGSQLNGSDVHRDVTEPGTMLNTPPKGVANGKQEKSHFKNGTVDIIITSASPVPKSSLNGNEDSSRHKEVPKEEIDPGDVKSRGRQNGESIITGLTETDLTNNVPLNSKSAEAPPLRTPADSHSVTALYEDSLSPEDDISPIPPPWRNNDSPVEHDFHQDMPAEPDSNVLFTVGSHDELNDAKSAEEDVEVTTLPPPWRSGHMPEKAKHTIPVTSAIAPTWRQFSNDSSVAVRSPSVAATLDSMMPHPSCHSFRISEAESHHSLHMHMHNLIDPLHLPHNSSHCELETIQDMGSLDLPHCDSKERIVNWILHSDADPDLPVNDLDFEQEYESLKQLERDREMAMGCHQQESVRSAEVAERLPTVHEAENCADSVENLPMGTTAKTVNVTEKIQRCNSHKRNSPPVEMQIYKGKTEGAVSTADEWSYL